MPSKKSAKGKKQSNVNKEAIPQVQEKTEAKISAKTMLKCSGWTQDRNNLEVALFVGKKLKSDDIDIVFEEQKCHLKISDGREWDMHFFRPIDLTACKVQIKGMRINLKIKKKTEGNWLDIAFIHGQSDRHEKDSTGKIKLNSVLKAETTAQSKIESDKHKVNQNNLIENKDKKTVLSEETNSKVIEDEVDDHCMRSVSQSVENSTSVMNEQAITLPGLGEVIVGGIKPDVTDLLDEDDNKDSAVDLNASFGGLRDDDENMQAIEFIQEEDTSKSNVYSLNHIKHDFYEKTVVKANDTVTVQLFVKSIDKDTLKVIFQGTHVGVNFKTKDPKFLSLHKGTDENTVFSWSIEIVSDLIENQCKHKLTSNHLELTIRKKEAKRWSALEAITSKQKFQISDWIPVSSPKSPPASSKKNVIFDEFEQGKDSENATFSKSASSSEYFTNKGYLLSDGTKDYLKKPMCKVSPLKPPTEQQVVTPGYTGLDNLGNTCFMNSVLQVLSNTTELRNYFLDGAFQKDINTNNPLGSGGKLAVEFAMLLKVLWSGSKYSYAPSNLKKLVAQKKSMFMGFAQHDAQEYMSFLLDGLHEDVNRVKHKPYIEQVDSNGRPDEEVAEEFWSNHKRRNDSFLVDLFQGQYKSTLVCPVCDKVSVTFDPFMHLPVPLPKKQRLLPVFFVPRDPSHRPVKYMLRIPKDATVDHLKDSIYQKTHVSPQNLLVFEAYQGRIHSMFHKGESLSNVTTSDLIIVQEVLSEKLTGEPVHIIPVIQRVRYPIRSSRPTFCGYCRKDVQPNANAKLLRCTGCYKVGYCSSDCQKQHWNDHRRMCTSETVGMPFVISLPQSLATYTRISQLAERYSRYSIDVFQPPQQNVISAPNSPEKDLEGRNPLSKETLNKHQSNEDLAVICINKNNEQGDNQNTEDVVDNRADADGNVMEKVEVDNINCEGEQGNIMTSSTSSQGSDSSGNEQTVDNMSVSTSTTSLSTDTEETKPIKAENLENHDNNEKDDNSTPIRAVIGQQKEGEKSAPQFKLVPLHKTSVTLRTKKEMQDLGDEPIVLDKDECLGMDWKNSEKDKPYVKVQNKEFAYIEDPSVHSVLVEENRNITLEQSLALFTEPEVLSAQEAWYCPKCKEHREASKQLAYWRLPKILIIQLKRFSYRNLLWCDKVDKFVEFPVTGLDMTPYCEGNSTISGERAMYDLYGVVNHYGGIMGGHYTAFTRCVDSSDQTRNELGWRCCDDRHVTSCSENQVVTSAAYVLFYRLRESPLVINPQDSVLTSQDSSFSYNKNANSSKKNEEQVNEQERPLFTIGQNNLDSEDRRSSTNSINFSPSYSNFNFGGDPEGSDGKVRKFTGKSPIWDTSIDTKETEALLNSEDDIFNDQNAKLDLYSDMDTVD